MVITIQLPNDLAQHCDRGREALEALAIEGYRSGAFSHHQSAQLLGMTRFEFEGFLKERGVYEHAYDVEDLEHDMRTLKRLQEKGLFQPPGPGNGLWLNADC